MQGSIRKWFIAMRPWSLTASVIPICFGASMAAISGKWSTLLFILTLLGGMALHLAANALNTYGDFKSGVDSVDYSGASHNLIVTGAISPSAMYKAGMVCFGVAAIIGVALIALRGWWVLPIGIIGIIGAYAYTCGKMPYKYAGLGPYFVFILMGPLMSLPTYCIITGSFAAAPILGSLSIACLVSAIMHANDMRDISHDREAGIQTIAMRHGLKSAILIYAGLNLAAFALVGVNVQLGTIPATSLVVFLLLPLLLRELRRLQKQKTDLEKLLGWSAAFHMQFGLALSIGVIIPLAL